MYLAQVTFGVAGPKPNRWNEQTDAVESLLGDMVKNGQLLGEFLFVRVRGQLVGYANLARPDSFDPRNHSEWGQKYLAAVIEVFGRPPRWRTLDDDVPKRFRSWRRSNSLFLASHAFDDNSPVCCGDTGRPIPTYLLPISGLDRESLYFWSCEYAAHDRVWLASADLEIPAYRQMADSGSGLAEKGRDLCRIIERATKLPTYYHLQRYWGYVDDREDARPCPVCGRKWRDSSVDADATPYHHFHFRCRRCRLASHRAVSFDQPRGARIGEFSAKH